MAEAYVNLVGRDLAEAHRNITHLKDWKDRGRLLLCRGRRGGRLSEGGRRGLFFRRSFFNQRITEIASKAVFPILFRNLYKLVDVI